MHSTQLTRLKASISKFEALPMFMARLEKTGHLQALLHIFSQVFATEHGKLPLSDVKDCMRLVTEVLLDEAFKTADISVSAGKTTTASDTSRALVSDRNAGEDFYSPPMEFTAETKTSGSKPKPSAPQDKTDSSRSVRALPCPWPQSANSSPAHSRQKSEVTVPKAVSSQHSSPAKGANEDLKGLSDFANPVPTALFTKAKRKTLEVRELSPGPAHYTPGLVSTKARAVQTVVPQGGKRFEFQVPETPGPAFYTPLRSFLAKHQH